MNERLYRVFSILLSAVVILSTMSFTIDTHYCGGTRVDTSVIHKAKSCGMDLQKTDQALSITKESCCINKQLVIVGQDELQLSFDNHTSEQQIFFALFVITNINLFEGLDKNVAPHQSYRPPLVIKQIYKVDETYLI